MYIYKYVIYIYKYICMSYVCMQTNAITKIGIVKDKNKFNDQIRF